MKVATDLYALKELLNSFKGKVFVLCDENTFTHCYEMFATKIGQSFQTIIIKAGEETKNLRTCEIIWNNLLNEEAHKDALLINLGGGVLSDIGGFVAATFKRGIKYVNVPTTLLAMVDAASGGKTGVNFHHYKNIIGLIQQPELVIIHTPFLNTLPEQHLRNGFAEMLKHALLSSSNDLDELIAGYESKSFLTQESIFKSLAIKEAIVAKDPNEKGLRKVLNLGHTLGHAIEFAAHENNHTILHGEAVAIGLIASLKLSVLKLNFDANKAQSLISFINQIYAVPKWLISSHDKISQAIIQDKKNISNNITMVLLKELGKPVYDIPLRLKEIELVLKDMYLND